MKKYWKLLVVVLPFVLLLPASCDKEPQEEPYREPYEKELFFNQKNIDSIAEPIVQKYADDTACKHIWMVVEEDNNYTSYDAEDISIIRTMFQNRIDISDKVSGRGDFHFRPNTVSEADSLWFVQNGWTIRQKQY